MNIDWLHSFKEAARHKSFSKAAISNHISQPALSKHIQHLEKNLDVQLFHRSATGITLTDAGEHFYHRITPILSELANIRDELHKLNQNKTIAIGSLPSIATYYLPKRLKKVKSEERNIAVFLQNTSDELLNSVREGKLDAAFVEKEYVDRYLWSHEVFTESFYALFPLHHKYQSKKSVKLIELTNEAFITHQAPCDVRQKIVQQMALIGYQPNIVSEVAFGDFVYGSVAAGMGITIIPEILAKNLHHPQLFSLPIIDFGKKRTISLVTKDPTLGAFLSQYL